MTPAEKVIIRVYREKYAGRTRYQGSSWPTARACEDTADACGITTNRVRQVVKKAL
jgi:hypothetical protein